MKAKLMLFIIGLHLILAALLSLWVGCMRCEAELSYRWIVACAVIGYMIVIWTGLVGVFPKPAKEIQ